MVATVQTPFTIDSEGHSTQLCVMYINGAIVVRPWNGETAPSDPTPLTERESEILSLVAEGAFESIIGAVLAISVRTVRNHINSIINKLGASDRTHAVVIAVRLGWLAI